MKQPFTMTIKPLRNNEVIATIFEQLFPAMLGGISIPPKEVASITGLPYVSAQDDILQALRANGYKPIVLTQKKPIELNEVSGVRLTLLFKIISPLTSVDAIRAVQWRIAAMSDEEVYYWFAKCYGEHTERATHAFRILHGVEPIPSSDVPENGQEVQAHQLSACACGCGKSVFSHNGKGRPSKYFSGACRVRAHRATKAV